MSNPKIENIEPNPTKPKITVKAFEEFVQRKHTLKSLGERPNFWSVASKKSRIVEYSKLSASLFSAKHLTAVRLARASCR